MKTIGTRREREKGNDTQEGLDSNPGPCSEDSSLQYIGALAQPDEL